MAQASSAQREPSMEEILASIRRIIEDNDAGRKQADEPVQARPEQGRTGAQAAGPTPASAERLGLQVAVHRPQEHYDAVKDKWGGLRTPDGR